MKVRWSVLLLVFVVLCLAFSASVPAQAQLPPPVVPGVQFDNMAGETETYFNYMELYGVWHDMTTWRCWYEVPTAPAPNDYHPWIKVTKGWKWYNSQGQLLCGSGYIVDIYYDQADWATGYQGLWIDNFVNPARTEGDATEENLRPQSADTSKTERGYFIEAGVDYYNGNTQQSTNCVYASKILGWRQNP